jgi:hypothetical protein
VVYVGKSSFKMKAAAMTTPPAGVAPTARSTPTPPPGYVTRTLPPLGPPSRPPAPLGRLDREVSLTKATLAGVCMAAFSCGIVCSVAIYRFAPSLRPDCASPVETAEVAPRPAAAPPAEVATRPKPPAPRMPDVEPLPSVAPLPVVDPPPDIAPPPPPRAAAPTPAPPRAAGPARALPAARPAAAARKDMKKDRPIFRKRATRAAAGSNSHTATESWNDPFQ